MAREGLWGQIIQGELSAQGGGTPLPRIRHVQQITSETGEHFRNSKQQTRQMGDSLLLFCFSLILGNTLNAQMGIFGIVLFQRDFQRVFLGNLEPNFLRFQEFLSSTNHLSNLKKFKAQNNSFNTFQKSLCHKIQKLFDSLEKMEFSK